MYGGVCSLLCLFEVLEVCGHVRKEGSLGDFLEEEGTRMSYLQERHVGEKLCMTL